MAGELLTDAQVFGGGGLLSDADVFGEVEVDRGGEGVGFWDRALASFKNDPASYYRARYGSENVRAQGGEVLVRPSPTERWRPADSTRLELADIADLFGDVPEMLGSLVGGVGGAALGAPTGPGAIGTGVAGAAGGAAVGNLVKQGIGAMIPGAEDRTVLERAGEAGRAGLLGGATQGVGNVLARPIAQLLSTGQVPKAAAAWLAGRAERAAAPGVVAEGRALERAIPGLELDTAQLTGSQSLKRVQEASEFGPFASSFGREGLEGNMNAVMAELDRTMSSITGGVQVDAQALGHTLKTTRDDWADQLFRARSQQAAQDFAAVDSAVGHTPIVDPSRARAIIQKRMAENTDDHGERILEGLQKDLLHWVKRFDDPLSASDMQKYLRLFGNAGYGKGAKVFDSLHMGEAVRLQRDLHRALLDDLADTAAQAQGSTAAKQLSDALMRARGNYKMASEQIEKLEKSALNRIVGEITEENYYRAGERFLGLKSVNAQDQIIRSVRGVDPGSADVLARGVLENAIERSMVVPQGSATGERIFSPTRFLKMMPEKKVRDVLFGDPAIGQQIDNIMAAMRRLNLKGYKGESPTAEKLINYGTISGIGVGQLLSPMTGAAALIGIIGRRQVAKHLMTTQGRNALQQIMHPTGPTTPPHARKALMYLMSENVVE